jgi:hypothetical protein
VRAFYPPPSPFPSSSVFLNLAVIWGDISCCNLATYC